MGVISSLNDIRVGTYVLFQNQPYRVVEANFMRTAQRKPVMQTKLKNLIDNKTVEYSFKYGEKVETPDLNRSKAGYLYSDDNGAYFMDNSNYEQFDIPKDVIGDKINYLKEGTEIDVLYFEGKPVSIDLPIKVELKVTSAPPGIKGDSSSNVTKSVTVETGAQLNVPLFIKEDDVIRINTETGEYVERVN